MFSVKLTSYQLKPVGSFDDVIEVHDGSQTSPGNSCDVSNGSHDVHNDNHDVPNGALDEPKVTPQVPSSTNQVGPSRNVSISTFFFITAEQRSVITSEVDARQ